MLLLKNILNFYHRKNWKEAIGFFVFLSITGFVFVIIITIVDSIIFPTNTSTEAYARGLEIGVYGGMIYNFIIALLLIKTRKLYVKKSCMILVGLALFMSLLKLGLISEMILAFLTTRKTTE